MWEYIYLLVKRSEHEFECFKLMISYTIDIVKS